MEHTVESKYKNPDKFIEQLKSLLGRQAVQSEHLASLVQKVGGSHVINFKDEGLEFNYRTECFDGLVPDDVVIVLCRVDTVTLSKKDGGRRLGKIDLEVTELRKQGGR